MSATSSRLPAFARWSALPIGLIVSAALVWQSSYAAFTASTTNPTNNWATGTVSISDDDSETAMFNASTLKTGDSGEKCIVVTYGGSLGANVKLFGTGFAQTNSLGSYIDLTIQQGTGTGTFAGGCGTFTQDTGTSNLYTGTLANFASTYTNSSTGFGTWAPTGATQTRVYKIVYTINASTPNSAQGSTSSIGLTWEATA